MYDADIAPDPTTTAPGTKVDLVRWLIDQQSFNGAWSLNDADVLRLTNEKPLNAIKVTGVRKQEVVTTALAIAVLESNYQNDRSLWFAVVEKGRKQLLREGLTKGEVEALINEIKKQL